MPGFTHASTCRSSETTAWVDQLSTHAVMQRRYLMRSWGGVWDYGGGSNVGTIQSLFSPSQGCPLGLKSSGCCPPARLTSESQCSTWENQMSGTGNYYVTQVLCCKEKSKKMTKNISRANMLCTEQLNATCTVNMDMKWHEIFEGFLSYLAPPYWPRQRYGRRKSGWIAALHD